MIFYQLMIVYMLQSGVYTVMPVAALTRTTQRSCDLLAAGLTEDNPNTTYWCEERTIL